MKNQGLQRRSSLITVCMHSLHFVVAGKIDTGFHIASRGEQTSKDSEKSSDNVKIFQLTTIMIHPGTVPHDMKRFDRFRGS